jgi:hypothetical protein
MRATTAKVTTSNFLMNPLLIGGWLLVLPRTHCLDCPGAGYAVTRCSNNANPLDRQGGAETSQQRPFLPHLGIFGQGILPESAGFEGLQSLYRQQPDGGAGIEVPGLAEHRRRLVFSTGLGEDNSEQIMRKLVLGLQLERLPE